MFDVIPHRSMACATSEKWLDKCQRMLPHRIIMNRGIHHGLRHGHHEPADTEQPSLLLQQLEYSVVANSSDTIPPLYSISSGEKERRWNGFKCCTATDLKAHCLQETTAVASRQDFRIPNVLGVTNAMAIKEAFSSRVTRGY
ncbi:uncharacterized protein TNIN_452251 [Trichonephila inaurata madagascariensis]|uniref:Uncharacterized protein n=1 Tax=Trichonephila inaurata madagascariensis TaxID=2747483 RepID=A0A8X7CJ01_9ARAC|nr:uncharacterized protein TNIN_452251 [Trichonephila inaurata madagascariensis]